MRKNDYGGKVLSFWSWNSLIRTEEISRQLTEFADGYFDGVIIHARAGLETAYLSEDWFNAFGFAVSEAERLGLDVYIYDEDGWPSGFAGGRVNGLGEEYQLKGLRYGKPQQADKVRLVAAFEKTDDDSFHLIGLNEADRADLVFWYRADPHYVDLMSEKTVRAFIDCTHEEYKKRFSKYFGNVIKGVFTDEPQLDVIFPWSFTLPNKFKKQCGYDLLPLLWKLTEGGDGAEKLRADYFSVVSNAFFNAFTKQISEWCSENNLLFTGHFPCEDGLCVQLSPTGGVMKHYTAMHLPGIDHLGNMQHGPVLMKQVSSVAQQLGNGETLCEVFGCSGWDVPLKNLAWIWGRQSALGITTACCHLSAFTIEGIRKRDYPAFFSYQNLWWKDFSHLKRWIKNLNDLMAGERETNVALLSSLESVAGEFNGTWDSFKLRSFSSQFRQTLENLISVQLDAEIVDEGILAQYGAVENGMLRVGKRRYKYLAVPECESIKRSTFEKLAALSQLGARVIFVNSRPAVIDFEPAPELAEICAIEICNRACQLEKAVKAYGIEQPVKLLNPQDMSLIRGVTLHTVLTESGRRIHICCGESFSEMKTVLSVEGKCSFFKRDIYTGERQRLAHTCSGKESFCELKLHSMENIVIETDKYADLDFTEETLISSRCIVPESVAADDLNCITLDMAYYAAGDEKSELMPVINIAKILYENANPRMTAEVCYPFYVEAAENISDIRVAAEDRCIDAIFINGISIADRKGSRWLDRNIHEYEITDCIKPGENTVTLRYTVEKAQMNINIEEVFETERNRFFYPKEPESVYIRGNFDVTPTGKIENHGSYYRVSPAGFKITKPTAKQYAELTSQGLWFYRGNMNFIFVYCRKQKAARYVLRIEDALCSAFRWKIGEKVGEIFTSPYEQDITDALKNGENIIEICAVGSNRNLLGPHHHIKGKTNFVGVDTFIGKYGFEDFAYPEIRGGDTWDSAYNFVPFDCGKIFIDEYVVREEK